jgi:UDP-N-acetylmuramoyl-L-alanyl-D-glutamate--2,6-diaminopimelate ligase
MDLAHLTATLAGARLLAAGDGDVAVTGVAHDSRAVVAGDLFCCVRGEHTDGHDHAPQAVAAGAVAVLCERVLGVDAPQVVVPDVRVAMGPAAAAVHGHPAERLVVIGVTGTNGKTTTVHLLRSILEHAGRRSAVIGTLTGTRTTPEAPELQRRFAELLAEGIEAVAMEVSSHALALHRVDGTRFRVAVFTNLSADHLDFHRTMEEYFQAKARLFTPELADAAVVNTDDPRGRLLRDAALIPTRGFSLDEVVNLEVGRTASRFTWRGHQVSLPLGGRFNVTNALAAAEAAITLGIEPAVAAGGLAAAGPVPGRFEAVDAGQAFDVIVDYAHTPDGLERLLHTARELVGEGRVLVVFGCGGDRDRAKRPLMGEVAGRLADRVLLTSDNPRSEDPAVIISQVRSGFDDDRNLRVEPNRRRAIALALDEAVPGDIVVIAGKGHETTQTVGDATVAFDDRAVARELLT